MAIVTEDVTSSADAANGLAFALDIIATSSGAGGEGMAFVPALTVESTADSANAVDVANIGYSASSAAAGTGTAVGSLIMQSGPIESTALARGTPAIMVTGTASDTAAATGTADLSVDSFVTSSGDATNSVEIIPFRNVSLSSSGIAFGNPALEVTLEISSSGVASSSVALARTLAVLDSATAAEASAPSARVVLTATSSGVGANTTAARLLASLEIVSTAVAKDRPVVFDGLALWTNTKLLASAVWSALPFNSYAMHDGSLLAAGDDGLYAFGADSDDGAAIAAHVRGDLTDFGDPHIKTMDRAFINGRSEAPLTLTIATEDGEWQYDSDSATARLTNVPVDLGRGLYARHFRFALANQDGAFFSIRDVAVRLAASKRMR